MKMKTAELEGRMLDWAVAEAHGYKTLWRGRKRAEVLFPDAPRWVPCPCYSTDWSVGGPILEREKIGIGHSLDDETWLALSHDPDAPLFYGPTPLVAAMRCFVASKLGDEVDIQESSDGQNR
jgi:hypothetical protein